VSFGNIKTFFFCHVSKVHDGKANKHIEMELADSDAYEEDSCVEVNEGEAELCKEQEEARVGDKSNWELPQHAGSSRDIYRSTGHERSLKKSKAVPIDKWSSLTGKTASCILPSLYKKGQLLCSSVVADAARQVLATIQLNL
jgi:hypothetical protein